MTPKTPSKRHTTLTCRSCGQPIHMGRWRGRWFPIDTTPHPDGRWARIHGRWRKHIGVNYETAIETNRPLHPLHQCPARQKDNP